MDVTEWLEEAADALEAEIETVRERPSSDVLFDGTLQQERGEGEGADYRFETSQPALRFAEEIKARTGEKEWTVFPVSFDKNEVVLRFPEPAGESIRELYVEWENDFILLKTLGEIHRLSEAGRSLQERIRRLFDPSDEEVPGSREPLEDGRRNRAQLAAIEKALRFRSVYIWGPPGTGKTATLGYIIANYLREGKSVLFASNTNRAVDVGLLSTLHALDETGHPELKRGVTRFGEALLEDPRIEEVVFENQVDKILKTRQEEASDLGALLSRKKELMEAVEKRFRDGKQPTASLNTDLELIDLKISEEGGQDVLEAKMEELSYINERSELMRKRLVATTLAKVCTSDLFSGLEFDAVVVDEGSMASLPNMMVLAARAQWHTVVVGDPMQLPPIALTGNREAREFLEKDIFTTVSGARTPDELFAWHDANPEFTAFFDTQYRLKATLADIISTVFYEGRLKTGVPDQVNPDEEKAGGKGSPELELAPESPISPSGERAFHLIDTSKYQPFLEQKNGERGFNPVNTVHQKVLERLIRNMLGRGIRAEDIGVMLPFRSPVYDLRDLFYQQGIRDIEVGTIHTFQGREKPYIIFDTVMSGEGRGASARHYSVRPLDEEKNGLSVPRLLNVAFSRSSRELMILADMNHINRVYGGKFLGKLLDRMR
ncbi:MAG: AAA domain-containing protein [Balneolaceae bacterium]